MVTVTAAGYVGVTYDDVEWAPSSLDWVLWITRGLNGVPQVRGTDTVVPYRRGRVRRGRIADVRPIEGYGWLLAHGDTVDEVVTNYRESVAALQALFDPELEPRVLRAVLEDGTVVTTLASAVDLVITERVASHVAEVQVLMESVDPDWSVEAS